VKIADLRLLRSRIPLTFKDIKADVIHTSRLIDVTFLKKNDSKQGIIIEYGLSLCLIDCNKTT